MWLSLLLPAFAYDLTVRLAEDGRTVVGVLEVEAPYEQALALAHDPLLTAKIAETDMDIEPLRREGTCDQMRYTVRSVVVSLIYEARLCRSATGYTARYLRSEHLSDYQVSLGVEDLGGGRVRWTYRSLVVPDFYVPSSIFNHQSLREVEAFLGNVGAHMERW